jgi:histidine triad (HIT) family protein
MSQDQQQILEQQKAQCPFCKIARGEIPAQVIYQDSDIMAILDINPLKTGHILVFPKEHVPIIQMVPKKIQDSLWSILPSLFGAAKKGTVCTGAIGFVASGGVAGQQMPHMMLHIIPREHNDGISNFAKPIKNDSKADSIATALKKTVQTNLESDAIRTKQPQTTQSIPKTSQSPNQINQTTNANQTQTNQNNTTQQLQTTQTKPTEHVASPEQKALVAQYLEENQDMYDLLIEDPNAFANHIIKDPQLKNIFAGLDILVLSKKLKEANQ